MARTFKIRFDGDNESTEVTEHQFNVVTMLRRKFKSKNELETEARKYSAAYVTRALATAGRSQREADNRGTRFHLSSSHQNDETTTLTQGSATSLATAP